MALSNPSCGNLLSAEGWTRPPPEVLFSWNYLYPQKFGPLRQVFYAATYFSKNNFVASWVSLGDFCCFGIGFLLLFKWQTAQLTLKSEEEKWKQQHKSLLLKAEVIQQTRKEMLWPPPSTPTFPLPWTTTPPTESRQTGWPGDVQLLLMPHQYRKAGIVMW